MTLGRTHVWRPSKIIDWRPGRCRTAGTRRSPLSGPPGASSPPRSWRRAKGMPLRLVGKGVTSGAGPPSSVTAYCITGANHPVPLGYSIEWLTCAFASRSDVALVSLPGTAQDRLRAYMPYAVDSPHRLTRWASSSRSQRARRTAGAAACLAREALSASVRCRLSTAVVVIVTHLVTRSIASRCRERLLIRKLVSYWRVAAPGEPGSESGAQAAGLRITVQPRASSSLIWLAI
jgi:hypothetical protein